MWLDKGDYVLDITLFKLILCYNFHVHALTGRVFEGSKQILACDTTNSWINCFDRQFTFYDLSAYLQKKCLRVFLL